MRNLLITLVLFLTALTFYSALWFKSESIENDITARVTEKMDATDAKDIGIDVDGRHVTLSGIVYDETAETTYLNTAADTYGALGPIDGLTYQADGGYLTAIKGADGITLRGSVPNEDARAALLSVAQEATNGAVDDQLSIGGPVAPWQEEAAFGVSQLAGLNAGTLTAAAGTFALSGTTEGDASTVLGALAGRDGWQSFVSSSVAENTLNADVARLSDDVARLTGVVADRDAQLETLNSSIAARDSALDGRTSSVALLTTALAGSDAQIEELSAERDAISADLDALRANLTDGQASTEALSADLAAAQSGLSAAEALIAEKDAQIATLETEVANGQQAAGSVDEQVSALQGALDDANQSIADLNAQLSEQEATIVALQAATTQSSNAGADEIAALNATLAEREEALALDNEELTRLAAEIANRDAALAALEAEVQDGEVAQAALDTQLNQVLALVVARDATIESLRNQNPGATGASNIEQCTSQASRAIEGSRINFATGTAQIDSGSVPLLERLTGITLACASEGLTVEIGGHTDSQGSDDANQALSEARAQAVVSFMTTRGVPADGLVAVGYGESQPVADNDTSAGRAENRRISFDWQAR